MVVRVCFCVGVVLSSSFIVSTQDSFAREVNDWLADFQEARSLFNSSLDVFVDRMTRQFPKTLEKSFNYEIPMTKLVDELVKTIVEPAIQTHLTSLQSTINLSAETSDQLCHVSKHLLGVLKTRTVIAETREWGCPE